MQVPPSVTPGCGHHGRARPRGVPSGVLRGALLISLLVLHCGDTTEVTQEVSCGEGTVLGPQGRCVPENDLCPAGQVYAGGTCSQLPPPAVCGEGTVLRETGDCVPAEDLCPEGQVYSSGACVEALVCADGTVENEDGECVPEPHLCSAGEVYVDGRCRLDRTCGAGTNEVNGTCISSGEEAAIPDVLEGEEPNDSLLFGVPTPFVLPARGGTIVLGGIIEAPTLAWGTEEVVPDFDTFTFEGTVGQRLNVSTQTAGIPMVGFGIQTYDEHGEPRYVRVGLSTPGRTASRTVVLPFSATYELMVGEESNMERSYRIPNGYSGVWRGGDDWGYRVLVTVEATSTPVEQALPASWLVETAGLPTWRLEAEPGDVVELSHGPADWRDGQRDMGYLLSSGSGEYLGDSWGLKEEWVRARLTSPPRTLVVVPETGLVLTGDYRYETADPPALRVTATPHVVDDLGELEADAEIVREDAHTAGERPEPRIYRFSVTQPVIARIELAFTAEAEENSHTGLALGDQRLGVLATSNFATATGKNLVIALEPGMYHVVTTSLAGTPPFTLRLALSPLPMLDPEGVEGGSELLDIELESSGEAYFAFELDSPGAVSVTVEPSVSLDVAVELYTGRLLADTYFSPVASADQSGLGGRENVPAPFGPAVVSAPGLVVGRVVGIAGLGTFDAEVRVTPVLEVTGSGESPDSPEELGELGDVTLLRWSRTSPTWGLRWRFSVPTDGLLSVRVSPLGERRHALVATLLDSAATTFLARAETELLAACIHGVPDACTVELAEPLAAGEYLLGTGFPGGRCESDGRFGPHHVDQCDNFPGPGSAYLLSVSYTP
jgi:hypothetical protein